MTNHPAQVRAIADAEFFPHTEQYQHLRAAATRIEQLEQENATLERKYRQRLWLGHGHQGVYGDDGEMQCGECMPFGIWDYKREPLDVLERAQFALAASRLPAPPAAPAAPTTTMAFNDCTTCRHAKSLHDGPEGVCVANCTSLDPLIQCGCPRRFNLAAPTTDE